ncbi:MAG: glucose 1-dehydrogenase [Proteobacteria bacterium]|nr:glucose 1-dehydrogenase [Pseudomonadota bacterium]NIS62568.1 glucose 1-dehydrogenase [Pseudomonadota bacterium]
MLKDKVAIVTGGSRGIGKAIAQLFAKEEANLCVTALDRNRLETFVQNLREKNFNCIGVVADSTREDEVKGMVKETVKTFGRVDILVNNAGGGSPLVSIEEIELEEWERIIRNNLTSTYICCRAVIPHMKKQKNGKIVNVSSVAGRFFSQLSGPNYASAKAGIHGLTRQLARELGPFNIMVNAVAPGMTLTERVEKKWLSRAEDYQDRILSMIPLGHLAQPEDIAGPVLFLASNLSDYVTGVTLDVNGGFYMA